MTERPNPESVHRLLAEALVGLSDSSIARIAEASDFVELAPGATLAREGEPADAAFVVAEGAVQLAIHQRQADLVVATVGEGELLGWSWMVEPHRWSFDVASIGGARLVRLPATALQSLLEDEPTEGVALCRDLLGVVSRRLRDTRVQLLDVHAAAPGQAAGGSGAPGSEGLRDPRRGPDS